MEIGVCNDCDLTQGGVPSFPEWHVMQAPNTMPSFSLLMFDQT